MITENDLLFVAAFAALIATLLLLTCVSMALVHRLDCPRAPDDEALEAWARKARRLSIVGSLSLIAVFALGMGFVLTYGHASVPIWSLATAIVWVAFAGLTGSGISLLIEHAALTSLTDKAMVKMQDLMATAE